MTDKATPSPASVDSVMALAQHYAVALLDLDRNEGASPKRTFNAAMDALRAEVERLAAQAAPSEQADLRQLMGMNEAEIDTELIAAGISPDDAVKRADRAIKEALATIRAERRASSGATTQAVRMLTEYEQAAIIDMHSTGRAQGDHECAEAIQRKFCEVNNLRIPASGEIGSV